MEVLFYQPILDTPLGNGKERGVSHALRYLWKRLIPPRFVIFVPRT
jgi:hypothetical protein